MIRNNYVFELPEFETDDLFEFVKTKIPSDWHTKDNKNIPIEERNSDELSYIEGFDEKGDIKKIQIYPKKSKAMNLAFDVTPAKYVTGLISTGDDYYEYEKPSI